MYFSENSNLTFVQYDLTLGSDHGMSIYLPERKFVPGLLSTKFGGHIDFDSGDIMVLTFHVITVM